MTPEVMRIYKLLDDIFLSAKKIQNLVRDVTKEDFVHESHSDLQDITARRLTIIGEASAALLKKHPEFCENHPEIPLRQARAMRNIIIHEYDGIMWDLVWEVAVEAMPQLASTLSLFFKNNPSPALL